MKRIITLAIAGIMAAGMLTSCGKFTCDLCGEEKSGKKYESEMLGTKVVICKDCHELGEALVEGFGDIDLGDLGF